MHFNDLLDGSGMFITKEGRAMKTSIRKWKTLFLKTKIRCGLASLGLIGASQAFSTPAYYTFQGVTTEVQAVQGFASPYAFCQTVTFTVLIDRERLGEFVDEATGLTETIPGDAPGESFYAEWVGGNLSQTEPDDSDPASYHLGLQWGSQSQILISNANPSGFDLLTISHPTQNIDDWNVGTVGFESGHGMLSNNVFAEVAAFRLTLTSISETPLPSGPATIPEPAPMALLAFGLIGLAGARRRLSSGAHQAMLTRSPHENA
jgi:PEP-CTERM motif